MGGSKGGAPEDRTRFKKIFKFGDIKLKNQSPFIDFMISLQ